jgi:hypothetical protein
MVIGCGSAPAFVPERTVVKLHSAMMIAITARTVASILRQEFAFPFAACCSVISFPL